MHANYIKMPIAKYWISPRTKKETEVNSGGGLIAASLIASINLTSL